MEEKDEQNKKGTPRTVYRRKTVKDGMTLTEDGGGGVVVNFGQKEERKKEEKRKRYGEEETRMGIK